MLHWQNLLRLLTLPWWCTPPGSEVIARIGAGKLLAGETVSVEALDANYLRRSDAEIFFKGNR